MRLLAALFGFLTGVVCGFTMVYLWPRFFRDPLYQAIGGGLVGGVFGSIIGSISAEINASEAPSHKVLVAFIFGAIGGYVGATRLEHLWLALRYYQIPSPF